MWRQQILAVRIDENGLLRGYSLSELIYSKAMNIVYQRIAFVTSERRNSFLGQRKPSTYKDYLAVLLLLSFINQHHQPCEDSHAVMLSLSNKLQQTRLETYYDSYRKD